MNTQHPENIQKIIHHCNEGDKLFMQSEFKEALAHYKIAFTEAGQIPDFDKVTIENLKKQIAACEQPEKLPELSEGKKNWLKKHFGGFGGGLADIGKNAVSGIIKKFIPRMKEAIEKNKPKAIDFMRGKLDMHFKPIPENQTPQKRIVIIELYEDPSGDPSKDDVIIQIKRADYTQINVARDESGKDLSAIETHSGMSFLNDILAQNLEEAVDNFDFDAMKNK